jgi:hypothetical protein
MKARISLFIGMSIICACASAQMPEPRAPITQPVTPSTLPEKAYRYGDDYPYAIDHDTYGYDTRDLCISQDTSREASESNELSGDATTEDVTPTAIDWCALPPYRPRYAPQTPASWRWYHGAPWRYWSTR